MIDGGGGLEELGGLHLAWIRAEHLPAGTGWLTPEERQVFDGLRLEKRRTDWLLGRWAAKLAVRSALGRAAPEMAILAGSDGRPLVHLGTGEQMGVDVSLSHSVGVGFAAAGLDGPALGCDVESIESRSDAFIADYFTEAERTTVMAAEGTDRALLANLVWSAKESALKAIGEGLRLDTRAVEVDTVCLRVNGSDWSELMVSGARERIFRGSWRVRNGLVWTVLTESS